MTRIGNIKGSKKTVHEVGIERKNVRGARVRQTGDAEDERKRRFAHLTKDELRMKIDDSGRDFLTAPSTERFELYQDLLREAIDRAVSGGLAVTVDKTFSPDPKVFTVITRINADLMELAEEIRLSQLDRIRMGRLVEELKGLVADILG